MARNWLDRSITTDCAKCRLRRHGSLAPELRPGVERLRKTRLGAFVVPPQTKICTEGEASAEIFSLVDGWAFRYKLLSDGRRQILDFCLPGEFFGLGCEQSPGHDHSIESITNVVLCVFSKVQFEIAQQSDPALANLARRIIRSHESAVFDHLVNVGRRSAIEAVGHLLLELCLRQRDGHISKHCSCIFPVTQVLLADALGLTAAHVNRVLRRLREDDLVSMNDHNLIIHDVNRLSELCEFKKNYTTQMPVV